jgi:hypothetical protein
VLKAIPNKLVMIISWKVGSMKLTAVWINVETRPQYGTTKDFSVGIFDDEDKMNEAIKRAEQNFHNQRTAIVVDDEIEINKSKF